MHIREHLKTVNRHRRLVRGYCFKLGRYWQGWTHDLSKESPTARTRHHFEYLIDDCRREDGTSSIGG